MTITTQSFLKDSDLIAISDLSRESLELILQTAQKLDLDPQPSLLKGSILAACFFDPSTRTRLSFETAMLKGGGSVIGFSDSANTSVKKGESLSDTIRVIGSYADIIVIRHPQEGSARAAADATPQPVINAGDGANQHPTQTLIDLYSIARCQGKIDDSLHIAVAGDLKFGRTVHSLCQALAHYGSRLYFVSPEALSLPDSAQHELRKKGVKFSFHSSLEEVLPKVDVLYMTRIQKERFSTIEPIANPCLLKKKHLEKVKPNFRILHPLPRVEEIERSIDPTPYAYYFQQGSHGVPVRAALLALMLGRI